MHKAALVVLAVGGIIILAAIYAIIHRAWVNKQLNSAAKVYQQGQQAANKQYVGVRGELRKAEDFAKKEEQSFKRVL